MTFNATTNPEILQGFGTPQTAHNERDIRRMALNYNHDITNVDDFRHAVLYMDPVCGGGGHVDTRAILALCEGFGVNLAVGPKVQVLKDYKNGSTRKCMALHHDGHWALVVIDIGEGAESIKHESSEGAESSGDARSTEDAESTEDS
eukprot:g15134.t1